MRNEREEIEKRLLKETEENIKLKADEMLMSEELSKLRLAKVEPKRDRFGTTNTSLERQMIRAADNSKLFDLKSSEYKSYLKSSKLGSQQNSCSNRKINKNSHIVQNIKTATSTLSDKHGPSSNRNLHTFDHNNLTNRENKLDLDKTP
jgi:hypothetical protein